MSDSGSTTKFVTYHYDPSLVAAVVTTTLFALSTILHMWQCGRKRSRFMIPIIVGGLFEIAWYIGRILSARDKTALGPYIMQSLLLLLAPALFAATIYMILGRIILLTDGERFALVRRTLLTKIFVLGDVLSFMVQSAGGSMMASGDKDKTKAGEIIIVGGLFVQIIFFGFFVVVSMLFQRRGRQHLATIANEVPWKKHLYTLYATSILILIRSVFRVVEYLQGNNGYLITHEVFLYVFDALLMFTVLVAVNINHPGEIALLLKGAHRVQSEEMNRLSAPREVV